MSAEDEVVREFAAATADDLGRLIAAAAHSVNAALMAHLAAAGHPLVRPSHLAVFSGLQPGGTTITALARSAGISRQALSALVREVQGLGYVETTADADDRRAVRVRLTARGVDFCRAAIGASHALNAEFAERWGVEGLDDVKARLRQVTAPGPESR